MTIVLCIGGYFLIGVMLAVAHYYFDDFANGIGATLLVWFWPIMAPILFSVIVGERVAAWAKSRRNP